MTEDLSHHDEHALYLSNPSEWARVTAPRRAQMLTEAPDGATKRALWQAFGELSRQAIRELAEQQKREGA